jgi:hypothetical protein
MNRAFSSLLMVAALLAAGQSSARLDQSAAPHASLAQIQSPSLRIEFDKNMRSRVIARFGKKDVPLGAFSASETLKGTERSWYDFALNSQTHERVTDAYGAGEKLTLTGMSGVLKKNLSVTIYDEFPNLAVFDISYTNEDPGVDQQSLYDRRAARPGGFAFLVVSKRLLRASSGLDSSAARRILAAELSRHECE